MATQRPKRGYPAQLNRYPKSTTVISGWYTATTTTCEEGALVIPSCRRPRTLHFISKHPTRSPRKGAAGHAASGKLQEKRLVCLTVFQVEPCAEGRTLAAAQYLTHCWPRPEASSGSYQTHPCLSRYWQDYYLLFKKENWGQMLIQTGCRNKVS